MHILFLTQPSQRRVKELRTLQSWFSAICCLLKHRQFILQFILLSTVGNSPSKQRVRTSNSSNCVKVVLCCKPHLAKRWETDNPTEANCCFRCWTMVKHFVPCPCEVVVEHLCEQLQLGLKPRPRYFAPAQPRRRWRAPPAPRNRNRSPLISLNHLNTSILDTHEKTIWWIWKMYQIKCIKGHLQFHRLPAQP